MKTLTIDEFCDVLRASYQPLPKHAIKVTVEGDHNSTAPHRPFVREYAITRNPPSTPPSVDSTDAVEYHTFDGAGETLWVDANRYDAMATRVDAIFDRLTRLERWREAVLPLLSGVTHLRMLAVSADSSPVVSVGRPLMLGDVLDAFDPDIQRKSATESAFGGEPVKHD